MQDEEIILLEDTPEPEDAQQRTEEPELEFSLIYSEYPIPSVSADFTVPDNFGYPGVYHHIESPRSSRSAYRRDIIHHKDILLNHLPNPNRRANYIFSKVCERGSVTAVGGGSVSPVFLARLDTPEITPVLLLWECLVLEDHPRLGDLVEDLGTFYGSRVPKEDWELHYFLKVWLRLQDLFKLTEKGELPGLPFYSISRAIAEGREGARQVHLWYKEYYIYIQLVQFRLRQERGLERAIFDRIPQWREVEQLRVNPLCLHPDYYQVCSDLQKGLLGPKLGLERMGWTEIQAARVLGTGRLGRSAHQAERTPPAQ
jgi:hypothetical protein